MTAEASRGLTTPSASRFSPYTGRPTSESRFIAAAGLT